MGFTKTFIVFLIKIYTILTPSFLVKNGSLTLSTLFSSMLMTISLESINQLFFKDSDMKNVWMPIFIQAIMIFFYLGMISIDLLLGQRVAVKIRKESFDADRLIDTIAKVFATILISSLAMFLCILIEALSMDWVWLTSIISFCFIWVIIILYEFGSIGRHLESLTGSKPGIFKFFDEILAKVKAKAIKKVENSFKIIDNEDNKDNSST